MNQVLLDLTHTSHTRARTGIQRVGRSLYAALREKDEGVQPVCYDPFEKAWRPLRRAELANLTARGGAPAESRGARWPLPDRVAGRLRRLAGRPSTLDIRPSAAANALLVPELFSPEVGRALPALLARVAGPRAAIFYDAVPMQLPELSPPKSVARHPAYLRELLLFDGIAAISDDSRQVLLDYWRWLGVANPPPVAAIPLGIDRPEAAPAPTPGPESPPTVLSVGSIEGRKNHLGLLQACELLWARGLRFELRLIGLSQAPTGQAALARIRELRDAGRPIRHDRTASDAEVESAYRACAFSVYPSHREGFGLPVLESLSHGKPCVCSAHGALGESARGGGVLTVDRVDPAALAGAIERLLSDPALREELARAAVGRTFKTWAAYAEELIAWMKSLPRR